MLVIISYGYVTATYFYCNVCPSNQDYKYMCIQVGPGHKRRDYTLCRDNSQLQRGKKHINITDACASMFSGHGHNSRDTITLYTVAIVNYKVRTCNSNMLIVPVTIVKVVAVPVQTHIVFIIWYFSDSSLMVMTK